MSRYWVEHRGGTWTDVDLTANHFQLEENVEKNRLRALAMSGDLVFVAVPETATNGYTAINAAIAAAADDTFRQVATFELRNAAGEVHKWYSGTRTIGVADDSSSGTAAIADTASAITVKFVDGVGTVTLEYTGTWAAAEEVVLTLTAGDVLGTTLSNKTFTDTLADDTPAG